MSMTKKAIRERFRSSVFKRDGNKCRVCGRNDVALDAHHITDRTLMPNGGYVLENGITLCGNPDGCHRKAEAHWVGGSTKLREYHPVVLYKLINSSWELAYEVSQKLT